MNKHKKLAAALSVALSLGVGFAPLASAAPIEEGIEVGVDAAKSVIDWTKGSSSHHNHRYWHAGEQGHGHGASGRGHGRAEEFAGNHQGRFRQFRIHYGGFVCHKRYCKNKG